jgi:hypothetical protein
LIKYFICHRSIALIKFYNSYSAAILTQAPVLSDIK